jgi:hypothetical protein
MLIVIIDVNQISFFLAADQLPTRFSFTKKIKEHNYLQEELTNNNNYK